MSVSMHLNALGQTADRSPATQQAGSAAEGPYAKPRLVHDLRDCAFYHVMDVPGVGTVQGSWDLRPGIDRYLGHVAFAGKRVLDVGAASGFLSFHVERQGAEVVSYDLNESFSWDHVPYAGTDLIENDAINRAALRKINNAYWFCHRAFESSNRVVYGSVYTIPESIGPVDVAIFGSILLHLRDPFLALQMGTRLVRETVIVTDLIPRRRFWQRWFTPLLAPEMRFLPDARQRKNPGTWWTLPPQLVRKFLGVLGFENTRVVYHSQKFEGSIRLLYTIVGQRTRPAPVCFPAGEQALSGGFQSAIS